MQEYWTNLPENQKKLDSVGFSFSNSGVLQIGLTRLVFIHLGAPYRAYFVCYVILFVFSTWFNIICVTHVIIYNVFCSKRLILPSFVCSLIGWWLIKAPHEDKISGIKHALFTRTWLPRQWRIYWVEDRLLTFLDVCNSCPTQPTNQQGWQIYPWLANPLRSSPWHPRWTNPYHTYFQGPSTKAITHTKRYLWNLMQIQTVVYLQLLRALRELPKILIHYQHLCTKPCCAHKNNSN